MSVCMLVKIGTQKFKIHNFYSNFTIIDSTNVANFIFSSYI